MSAAYIIRYKKASTDDWYYMPVIGNETEVTARAKTVGKPELGVPAYSEVQVIGPLGEPVVWSSKNEPTVSSTNME